MMQKKVANELRSLKAELLKTYDYIIGVHKW